MEEIRQFETTLLEQLRLAWRVALLQTLSETTVGASRIRRHVGKIREIDCKDRREEAARLRPLYRIAARQVLYGLTTPTVLLLVYK